MNYIHTKSAPEAIGPYSQAMVANGVVYASGQKTFYRQGRIHGKQRRVKVSAVTIIDKQSIETIDGISAARLAW